MIYLFGYLIGYIISFIFIIKCDKILKPIKDDIQFNSYGDDGIMCLLLLTLITTFFSLFWPLILLTGVVYLIYKCKLPKFIRVKLEAKNHPINWR